MLMEALHARADRRAVVIPAGTLEAPTESLSLALGGPPASSGVTVTERTAAGLPVVFACDKIIKQDVAKTPIKLKRRLDDGTRKDDPNHPVYGLLHDLANPVMTAYEFKETMQGFLNLWGNAYAVIERGPGTTPKALWPLDPSRMSVGLDAQNRLQYCYRLSDGKAREWIFDPANPPILHLRQNALDGIHGRGPIQVLRESIGTALAADQYEGRFYGQGGHPRIALSTPAKLNDASARRVRQDVEQQTVGDHNWHRVLVLDHDLKPVQLAMPHRDAQFVDLQKLGRSELGGAFRVPAHKFGDLERSTFSNIEHQAIEYVGDCLMPLFVCWQQAIARDLLNPRSFNTHFATFVVDSLIRGDSTALSTALNLQRQNGVINANQWRRIVDMDDQIADADGGNLYLVNGNMMPMRRDPAATFDFPAGGGGVN
jgi:HK97 family phage portal protein